jgi:hypothetical protein
LAFFAAYKCVEVNNEIINNIREERVPPKYELCAAGNKLNMTRWRRTKSRGARGALFLSNSYYSSAWLAAHCHHFQQQRRQSHTIPSQKPSEQGKRNFHGVLTRLQKETGRAFDFLGHGNIYVSDDYN